MRLRSGVKIARPRRYTPQSQKRRGFQAGARCTHLPSTLHMPCTLEVQGMCCLASLNYSVFGFSSLRDPPLSPSPCTLLCVPCSGSGSAGRRFRRRPAPALSAYWGPAPPPSRPPRAKRGGSRSSKPYRPAGGSCEPFDGSQRVSACDGGARTACGRKVIPLPRGRPLTRGLRGELRSKGAPLCGVITSNFEPTAPVAEKKRPRRVRRQAEAMRTAGSALLHVGVRRRRSPSAVPGRKELLTLVRPLKFEAKWRPSSRTAPATRQQPAGTAIAAGDGLTPTRGRGFFPWVCCALLAGTRGAPL